MKSAGTASDADPTDDVADPLALEQQVCFALVVAGRSVLNIYRPILEPMGLTHPQYLVMLALWQRAPRTAKELAGLLQLDPGTLSPLLKRLESAGLVDRRRDPDDERQLAVGLTGQGRALREEALRVPPTVVARLGLEIGELQALQGALTRVIEAATDAHA